MIIPLEIKMPCKSIVYRFASIPNPTFSSVYLEKRIPLGNAAFSKEIYKKDCSRTKSADSIKDNHEQ